MLQRKTLFNLRKHVVLLLISACMLAHVSCEMSDISPENYRPKPGDPVHMVENLWGLPDDRETYFDGEVFVVTYYYYNEGIYIDFISDTVDLVGYLD